MDYISVVLKRLSTGIWHSGIAKQLPAKCCDLMLRSVGALTSFETDFFALVSARFLEVGMDLASDHHAIRGLARCGERSPWLAL